jgi:hypothetical protein
LEGKTMADVTIPKEPQPTGSPLIRNLTIAASALTAGSIAVNLILQVAHYLSKRPMQPDQRDRIDTAQVALRVGRQLPGLIKQVRLLVSQLRAVQ